MAFIDTAIGIGVVVAFLVLIWSKIYDHEKEHIDPFIKKIKGWFSREDKDDFFDPNEDFELAFRGNVQ